MRNYILNRDVRYADIPANLISQRSYDKIDAILDDPAGYKVTDEYNHDDVRTILRKHFGLNCVYCEASPIATSTFRIDHFRPKKNIKDEIGHTGYYWLAYEWTNLIQSCQLCNQHKSNYFPLSDLSTRVNDKILHVKEKAFRNPTTSPLRNEKRLLLHPELDEVESNFYFDGNGIIYGSTDEGKESIFCYDLKRDDLVFARKKVRDSYFSDIKKALLQYEKNLIALNVSAKEILKYSVREKLEKFLVLFKEMHSFSLFHLYMFEKFEDFFVRDLMIQEHKTLLLEIYVDFKKTE